MVSVLGISSQIRTLNFSCRAWLTAFVTRLRHHQLDVHGLGVGEPPHDRRCLGQFMVLLDNTIVGAALPDMQQRLHTQLTGLQWIVDAYVLLVAMLLLSGGVFADRFGRKKPFLAGVLVFTAASVVCAAAPTIGWLIAGRVLQGIGDAALSPASLSLLAAAYPVSQERVRAIGLLAGLSRHPRRLRGGRRAGLGTDAALAALPATAVHGLRHRDDRCRFRAHGLVLLLPVLRLRPGRLDLASRGSDPARHARDGRRQPVRGTARRPVRLPDHGHPRADAGRAGTAGPGLRARRDRLYERVVAGWLSSASVSLWPCLR
ncbi:MFS transporter [Actinomadura nitritigenes]|uniref:MFS transporter n=1 Tax=Actinomadura nitritigenes TaxID=134602 RepID=UPI003694E53B